MTDYSTPIVYVSNASWHYGLPTNRQQLPQRLANHAQVLYSSPFSLSQALLGRVRFRHYHFGVREVYPNLHLFHNLQFLPLVRAQTWPLKQFDQWLCTQSLKHQIRKLGLEDPILWLYFPPSFQYLIGELGESLTCYHCTDDHAGYAEALGLERDEVEEAETRLVQAVDVVFTTSKPLYEQKSRHNPNTFLMPNVADVGRFATIADGTVELAPDLADLPKPVVGFVGAIDAYKVDLPLIEKVAGMLPDWTFVFVGPIGSGDGTNPADLPVFPNLHFFGSRPYSVLPNYIAGFDICTIPYRLNGYTSGVFPLKFWEYLASGKPVVTTPLPALHEYYDYVEVADAPKSFVAALRRALATAADETAKEKRLELSAAQSWEKRADEMLQILGTLV